MKPKLRSPDWLPRPSLLLAAPGLLLIAVLLVWNPARLVSGQATAPPNIILFLTDDQRYDTLEYMPIVQRELVSRGVTFTNAYATTPYCCPSRASILTGLYAHNHGVLTNERPNGGYERFRDASTIATWLQRRGVRTMLLGKYLNQYESTRVPPGWSEWFALLDTGFKYFDFTINDNGQTRHYPSDEHWYSTDVLTQRALEQLQSTPGPFFLYLSYEAPHDPAEPASQDGPAFRGTPLPALPGYNEEDVSDKPSWIRRLPRITASRARKLDKFRRDQLASLQSVDRSIGAIVELLRASGRLENTWLVFMSDNGISLGEHRYGWQKSCGYEECVRVPLIVVPPAPASAPALPRTDHHLVLNIDLAPTFSEIAGATPESAVDGQSLLPLLGNPAVAWRDEAGLELLNEDEESGFRGLRTGQWKYLQYLNGEQELYDLDQDPAELENLAGQPEQTARLAELAARLEALLR